MLGNWDRGEEKGSFFSITIEVDATPKLTIKGETIIELDVDEVINFVPLPLYIYRLLNSFTIAFVFSLSVVADLNSHRKS